MHHQRRQLQSRCGDGRRQEIVSLLPLIKRKANICQVFRVPTTQDVLTSLFHPLHPKSHLDLVNLALLGGQILLFLALPRTVGRALFLIYFAFWRLAYDVGLGWVLTKQSKRRWIVREVKARGWLDPKRRPAVYEWIRNELRNKMGKDYSFDVSSHSRDLNFTYGCIGPARRVQHMASLPSARRHHPYQRFPFVLHVRVHRIPRPGRSLRWHPPPSVRFHHLRLALTNLVVAGSSASP